MKLVKEEMRCRKYKISFKCSEIYVSPGCENTFVFHNTDVLKKKIVLVAFHYIVDNLLNCLIQSSQICQNGIINHILYMK